MIKIKTSEGVIEIELQSNKAPVTCQNFLRYVEEGFYDGTIFHRVIPNFMVQGGGFEAGMQQKATHQPIKNEANNGLKNATGTLAMARTSDPDSASSQFFINVKDNHFLNYQSPTQDGWGYCVFAKVTKGMAVVHDIERVPTGSSGFHQDVPARDIVIETIEIIE